MKLRIRISLLLATVAALAMTRPASAEWKNDLTLYLWGSDISGNATVGRLKVPIDIGFDEIFDNLEAGIQAHYEGMSGQWGLGLDFTYLDAGNTNDAGVEVEAKTVLAEAFGIYRVNEMLDLIAGARFMELDMTVTAPGLAQAEGDRSLTDFFGGLRIRLPLSDTVGVFLRGDAGAGDSDLVWNVVTGLTWQASKSIALRAGYRWLDYDVENNDKPLERTLEMRMEGPFAGIGFQW
jgi:opacity protein-like surface antigen